MALSRARKAAVASIALGGIVLIGVACGPGDLSGLTKGYGLSSDGGKTTTPPVGPGCKDRVAPAANPNASNSGGGFGSDLTFAADNIRIDGNTAFTDASLPIPDGLDLDQRCTCYPDQPSCVSYHDAAATCDGDGGTDNAAASQLGFLINLIPSLAPELVHQRIVNGIYSIVFDVIEWNGQPDDPHVQVAVRMSTGIDNGVDGNGQPVPPQLNGSDVWSIDPDSISDGTEAIASGRQCSETPGTCIPKAVDNFGYVVGGKVVAHFANIAFSLSPAGANRFSVGFVGVTLVADISTDPSTNALRLDGEMSGRWLTDSILAGVGALGAEEDGGLGPAIAETCGSAYAVFKGNLCAAADLAADPNQDNTGQPCGAMSESMRFTAIPAVAGHVHQGSSSLVACGDHTNDSCSKP